MKGQNGGGSYSPAPTKEVEVLLDFNHDKSARTCCEKCAISFCGLGFVILLGSLVAGFLLKPYVNSRIAGAMALADGEPAFLGWKDPPVTPIMKVFFFNLTNEKDLLEGRDRPRVEKIGPYTYTQRIHKPDPVFSSSGEWVTFSESKSYFFSPELSEGTEEDVIVMPNIPLFGAFRKLGGSGIIEFTKREMFKSIFSGKEGIDKTPFLTLSVGEFLWGYPSILMTMDGDWGGEGSSNNEKKEKEERKRRGEESESEDVVGFESKEVNRETNRLEKQRQWADFDQSFGDDFDDWNDGWGDDDDNADIVSRRRRRKRDTRFRELNYKQFGFFHGRNETSLGLRTVHTGLGNITRKGDVLSVGNEEGARGNWEEPRCNRIEGKDPGTLSIGLTKADDLLLYFPNLCRNIPFRYQKTVTHEGTEAFRYSPVEQTFHNPQFEPGNSCYCHGRPCLPSGVFDLGIGCPYPQAGNPVYMSWPHFLHGDSVLREAVEGLTPPDVNNHSFVLDIQPDWGITLSAKGRFQFNVLVEPSKEFPWLANVKDKVMLPFLMLDEGVPEPNGFIKAQVNLVTTMADQVKSLTLLVGASLSFLCMAPEIFLWARSCCQQQQRS